jgi:hypothetical protein
MDHDETLWLAGLLEGEGWFGITNRKTAWGTATVKLNMKDRDIVWRAAVLMGSTSIHTTQPAKSHWSVTYQAQVYGQKAIRIMQAILPLMGERRSNQIKDCIDHEADKPQHSSVGEDNSMAKLTTDQVRRIRSSKKKGVDIANELGVSQATVSLIRHRVTWPKVQDEKPPGLQESVSSGGP